jgi:CelD/BcsL family acetyltransferase involved in cellulose biosynthesis
LISLNEYTIVNDPSREEWASFLTKLAAGNLQQSLEYGEAAKEANPHTRVVRLLAFDGKTPVGLVQARYNRRFGFGDCVEVGGVYGNGPVVADIEDKRNVVRKLVTALEKHATRNRVSEAFVYRLETDGVLENMGYALVLSFNVYKVPLGKGVDELWKSIAHNKRRNIKRAQEQRVEVVSGSNYDDLVSFYEMHEISGKRAGFVPHPFSYFHGYLKVFREKEQVKIFQARLNSRHVAGVFVVVHGDTAYALGAGSLEEDWQVRPNDILHWKAMEWACNEGLSYYHMGHVNEPPPTEGESGWGLWRWKREWGGQFEKTFVYHKVYMPRFRRFVLTPYTKIYRAKRKMSF